MHKIIISILLVLTFLCSCSKTNETAEYWADKSNALWEVDKNKYTDPKKAVEYLNNAIKLKPDFAEAYGARGNAYCDLGQYQNAIKDYNEVIRLKPNDAVAYINRGSGYGSFRQYKHSIADYSKAIRLKPDYALGYSGRGLAYFKQGNNNLGCRDVQKACELEHCELLAWAKSKGKCR
jgi:tetratricopeptide (TPR) repeat protein